MRRGTRSIISNQEGSVLMITLILLFLASMIGFIAIKTATTGILMAGNYKTGMQAFYTADSVTKYVKTNPTTFDLNLYPNQLSTQSFTDPSLPGTTTVTYLKTGKAGAGTTKNARLNYYLMRTTVTGAGNAREKHEVIITQLRQ